MSTADVGNGRALLHDHANADARERDAARRRETAGLVVDVHRRHREDDGIECLLRELLVDVERRTDGEGHLIAGLLFEVSGDRFRRDLRRADGEHALPRRQWRGRMRR
jgi:hypothetical protein